jgi:lysophospholipid acyltransferase (LPLAT)-like uncharacterized protein
VGKLFRRFLLPFIAFWFYRLLSWSWRCEFIHDEEVRALMAQRQPIVFAHWHGEELTMVPHAGQFRIATMTSTSADGNLMDHLVRKFGAVTSRGSSTRGGVRALVGLIKLVRGGHNATVAVDGPKGPIHVVKPGVFELAAKCDAVIVAMGSATSSGHIFKRSWNRAILPKPFARVVICFRPSWVPKDQTEQEKAAYLSEQIFYAGRQAAQVIADARSGC